jgi:hypothetical protein
MGDDKGSQPLARRVPGATRAAPGEAERPVLPEALLQRMQAVVSAAHAQAAAEQRLASGEEAGGGPEARPATASPSPSPLPQRARAASNGSKPLDTALPTSSPPGWSHPDDESNADDDTSPLPRLTASGAIAVPVKRDRHAAKRQRAAQRERERVAQQQRAIQERARTAEQARQRAAEREREQAAERERKLAAERERKLAIERERVLAAEQERQRAAELERQRAEQERERAAERQREHPEQRERQIAAAVTTPADLLEHPRPRTRRPNDRRHRPAILVATALVLVAAGSLAVALSATGSKPATASAPATPALAVAWVAREVSRTATVACDPAMCRALEASGVERLLVLGPATADPRRSQLIVATAAVRAEFGVSLGAAYAPSVIASFGSGSTRIDIRVVAPDGPTAYQAALQTDVQNRKQAGAQLLVSGRVAASASAQRQMRAGQVDSQLLLAITGLAPYSPVDVVAFGDSAPGASAGMPLRSAELAETGGAAAMRSWLAFLHGQTGEFAPSLVKTIRLSGHPILLIEFAAPTPLGLFAAS